MPTDVEILKLVALPRSTARAESRQPASDTSA